MISSFWLLLLLLLHVCFSPKRWVFYLRVAQDCVVQGSGLSLSLSLSLAPVSFQAPLLSPGLVSFNTTGMVPKPISTGLCLQEELQLLFCCVC